MNKPYVEILEILEMIDEVELNYLVHQLREGKVSNQALSQRIYRAKTKKDFLTMKMAMCIIQAEGKF